MFSEPADIPPVSSERDDVYHMYAYKAKLHRAIPESGYLPGSHSRMMHLSKRKLTTGYGWSSRRAGGHGRARSGLKNKSMSF
jgi:hypothetical protein